MGLGAGIRSEERHVFDSDDMSQPVELDNGSTLPPYTWPSDDAFPDDATFGYPTHDLSFVVEEMWQSTLSGTSVRLEQVI